MNPAAIIASAATFTSPATAQSYADRAFETTGTSLRIVMIEAPYYVAVSPRQASILVKAGYEMA